MIELSIALDKVDYASLMEIYLPLLLARLPISDDNSFVTSILANIGDLSTSIAKATLDVIPQSKKDEIAVACLNHYSENISKLLTQYAEDKNIHLNVKEVRAIIPE